MHFGLACFHADSRSEELFVSCTVAVQLLKRTGRGAVKDPGGKVGQLADLFSNRSCLAAKLTTTISGPRGKGVSLTDRHPMPMKNHLAKCIFRRQERKKVVSKEEYMLVRATSLTRPSWA